MAKVARRKTTFEKDGAVITFSPLTYGQLEEYAEKSKEINEKNKDKKFEDLSLEQKKEYRALRLWVICCAMNNADPNLKLTPEEAVEELDDMIAAPLWDKIIEFSGLEVPKPKAAVSEGESEAGS